MHAAVRGRGAARNQLGDVDGGVGADVRIVGAAGNREPEPGGAALQRDVLVLPAIVAVRQLCAVRGARRVRLIPNNQKKMVRRMGKSACCRLFVDVTMPCSVVEFRRPNTNKHTHSKNEHMLLIT